MKEFAPPAWLYGAEMTSTLYPSASVADEVVLITGATAGIGEACAYRFAEAGARLVLLGRRAERLSALQESLASKYGTQSHTVQLDVQDLDAVAALPETLPASFAAVSVLVNNAGLALGVSPAEANDMASVTTMLTTNVAAVMAFTRAFVPGFKQRGKGHLINVGSIAGHEAYAGGSVYCATKHAVDAFTTAARHDLVATPVRRAAAVAAVAAARHVLTASCAASSPLCFLPPAAAATLCELVRSCSTTLLSRCASPPSRPASSTPSSPPSGSAQRRRRAHRLASPDTSPGREGGRRPLHAHRRTAQQADAVYADVEPLVAADVADNIFYAATRPAHVQIADIVVLATNQAAAKAIARVGPSLGA